jgi:hypothetical protein
VACQRLPTGSNCNNLSVFVNYNIIRILSSFAKYPWLWYIECDKYDLQACEDDHLLLSWLGSSPLGTSNIGKSKRVRLHQLHRRNKTINPKFISYQYLEIIFTEVSSNTKQFNFIFFASWRNKMLRLKPKGYRIKSICLGIYRNHACDHCCWN